MQMNGSSRNCYYLPVSIGNSTFCGLKKEWSPRFNQPLLLAMSIIPVSLYWMFLFVYLKGLYRMLKKMHRRSVYTAMLKSQSLFQSSTVIKCRTPCCNIYEKQIIQMKLWFVVVITVLFKYLWDAIDITLDVYIFYQLERGDVIDEVIYRNTNVNNAIYIFALVGCICKVFAWRIFRHMSIFRAKSSSIRSPSQAEKFDLLHIARMKNMVYVASFIFEDGPELLLEYFYIEKYVTSFTWVLLVKDILLGIFAIITCITTLKFLLYGYQENRTIVSFICYGILVMAFTLSSLLRVGAACYQYLTKKLNRSCFVVSEGKISQTPFEQGCMREIDYVIAALTTVPLVLFGLIIIVNCCLSIISECLFEGHNKIPREGSRKRVITVSFFMYILSPAGGFTNLGQQSSKFFNYIYVKFGCKIFDCYKKRMDSTVLAPCEDFTSNAATVNQSELHHFGEAASTEKNNSSVYYDTRL